MLKSLQLTSVRIFPSTTYVRVGARSPSEQPDADVEGGVIPPCWRYSGGGEGLPKGHYPEADSFRSVDERQYPRFWKTVGCQRKPRTGFADWLIISRLSLTWGGFVLINMTFAGT